MSAGASRARLPLALIRLSLRAPRRVLAGWAIVLLLAVPGLARLDVDTSTDSVLDREDPAWGVYQHSQDLFGGDEILVIALEGETPYAPKVLRGVAALTRAFEGRPGVRRVDSIASVPVVHVTEAGVLELDPALDGHADDPGAHPDRVRQRLAADRIAPRSLVSEDGRVFAVNVVLERGSEQRHAELVQAARRAAAPYAGRVSGVPVFRVETNGRTRSEVMLYAPFTALVIGLVLFAVFRSFPAVLLCVAPGIAGSWLMLAAMGALDSPLTITTMILPSVILALGCAYAMHGLAAARGGSEPRSLEAALAPVALPVALSGLTTGIGFLAVALVRIEAVRYTGGFGALGVLTVTAAALTLVPAGLVGLRSGARSPLGFAWMRGELATALTRLAERRRSLLLWGWTLVALTMAAGATQLRVETDATQWLPVGNPVRDSYESIRASLSGISPVNVVIEPGDGRPATDPAIVAAADALATHLESLPTVGKAVSLGDPLRQIHGGFSDDPAQPLPDSGPLIEQYLLLLESVEPLEDLVTDDRSALNVVLRADHNGSAHLRDVAEQAERWWAAHGPPGVRGTPTGIMFEYARAEDEIALGQLRGLAFAIVAISAILLLIFRWPRLALLALIPNAVPLLVVFGLMGVLDVALDAGTVLVGGLALGIAVDDTVHLVSGFVDGREAGRPASEAMRDAFVRALPAVIYTTGLIALAFLVLGLSEFTFTRNFGLLTGAIVVLCLLSDALLLPALLMGLPTRTRSSEHRTAPM